MKEFKNVRGSQESVPHIEVNVDTTYIRTNIRPYEDENFTGWEYDEVQYSKEEYIELILERSSMLEQQLTDTQLALIELYEELL